MFKRMAAFVLSVVLTVSLCPAAAFAVSVRASDSAALQTQAGKATVYVISKITKTGVDTRGKRTALSSYEFSYQNNGLLKQVESRSLTGPSGTPRVTKYLYKGANMRKVIVGGIAQTFKLGANGLPTRITEGFEGDKTIFDFTYKSGRVSALKETHKYRIAGKWESSVFDQSFAYKSGRVVKATTQFETGSRTAKYSYDKQGNTKKFTGAFGTSESITYTNKYDKKKLLTQKIAKGLVDDTGTFTKYIYTYEYKPVKVAKTIRSKVDAQRWSLINSNRNYALGVMNPVA